MFNKKAGFLNPAFLFNLITRFKLELTAKHFNCKLTLLMGFNEKISENHKILEKCLEISAYNVGASRAYYCVFTSIKKYLTDRDFDYKAFLKKIKRPKDRLFSHGTIKQAIIEVLLKEKINKKIVCKLGLIDNLYIKRKVADYQDIDISEKEFKASINELKIIEEILKNE